MDEVTDQNLNRDSVWERITRGGKRPTPMRTAVADALRLHARVVAWSKCGLADWPCIAHGITCTTTFQL